jgi:hypothetical protein
MDQLFQYLTDDRTDTVHLIRMMRRNRHGEMIWCPWPRRTLCGKSAGGLLHGDETPSGIAATCERCQIAR